MRRRTAASSRSVEALDGLHRDRLSLVAREGEDRERVAAGLQPEGERGQRRLLDVEHAAALDPAVGRERGVDEDGDREVAGPVAGGEVDPVGADAAGGEVGARADQGVHVEFGAVDLGAQQLAPRPQRLEAAPDQADVAPGGRVRLPVLAVLRGGSARTAQWR